MTADLDSELFDASPIGDFGFGSGLAVDDYRELHAMFMAPTVAEAHRVVALSTAMPNEDETED